MPKVITVVVVFSQELSKSETAIGMIADYCQYFNVQIERHPFPKQIQILDRYTRTEAIEGERPTKQSSIAKGVLLSLGK